MSLSHNHGSSSLSDHSNHHQNLGNDNQDNLGGALPLISDNIQNSDINTNENTVSSTRENEVMSAQKNIRTENKGNKLYLILSLVFAVLSATLFILKRTIANFKAIKYSGWICFAVSAILFAIAIFHQYFLPRSWTKDDITFDSPIESDAHTPDILNQIISENASPNPST